MTPRTARWSPPRRRAAHRRPAAPTATGGPAAAHEKPRGLLGDAWHDLRRKPLFWISASLIMLFLVMAAFPCAVHLRRPDRRRRCPAAGSSRPADAWFGYDVQGRDVYARAIYGARASIVVAVLATLGTVLIGGAMRRHRRLPRRLGRRAALPGRRRLLRPAVRARRDRHPDHVQRPGRRTAASARSWCWSSLAGRARAGRSSMRIMRSSVLATKERRLHPGGAGAGRRPRPDHLQAPAPELPGAAAGLRDHPGRRRSSAPRPRCRSSVSACSPGGLLGHHDHEAQNYIRVVAVPAVLPRRVPRHRRAELRHARRGGPRGPRPEAAVGD